MSDIIFRSTDYPPQSNVAQPYKNISIAELNQTGKLLAAPFFKLTGPNNCIITEDTSEDIHTENGENLITERRKSTTEAPKLPAFVTPGGYHGAENFVASYSGKELTINPGYCMLDEVLIQFKKAYMLDVSKVENYMDIGYILPLSGNPSEITTSYTGKIYCVAYYSSYVAKGVSGTSGTSGVRNVFKDNYSAYIGIITQPDTYLTNYTKFCFLYYITVSVVRNKITAILSIGLTDPNNTLMTRRLPNFIYA